MLLKRYNYYDDEIIVSPAEIAFNKLISKIKILAKAAYRRLKSRIRSARKKSVIPAEAAAESIDKAAEPRRIHLAAGPSAILLLVIATTLFIAVSAGKIVGSENRIHQYYSDAAAVCTQIIADYGSCKLEAVDRNSGNDCWRFTGLSYVRQMDFNRDGSDELLTAYNNNGDYYVEVWGYSGREFIKLYSEKANTVSDASLGSWITIYHHSGKYYLGVINSENENEIELLALKGKKFKSASTCEYDAVNDLYAVKGEISTEFETIKLSYISSTKAEKIQDNVLSRINLFGTDNASENTAEKTEAEKKADAYYKIVEAQNEKYGKAALVSDSDLSYISGVAVVSLTDFNGDGNEELLIISRRDKKVAGTDSKGNYISETEPEYTLEVYGWNGTIAKKIFENSGLSVYQENDDSVFYILQNADEKINICTNSYTYNAKTKRSWRATSKINTMNEENTFEAAFTAVANCDYGYMTYTIDGKKVYRRDFATSGYIVPYFCNEDSYDKEEFSVTFLQGTADITPTLNKTVSDTQQTILQLNSHYSVD